MLQHHFDVVGVVTTVEAAQGQGHLNRHPGQERIAPRQALSPTARRITAVFGQVEACRTLDCQDRRVRFQQALQRFLGDAPRFVCTDWHHCGTLTCARILRR